MTDAAHMLTDVGSLALALFAVVASQWGPSDNFTFGFKRAEVVGALFSVILVWVLVGAIVYEGVVRLINVVHCARGTESQYTECEGIDARIMLIVGCTGLVINILTGAILWYGGAEVQHAHSHGDDHGHIEDEAEAVKSPVTGALLPTKCCAPSPHERDCREPGHVHVGSSRGEGYGTVETARDHHGHSHGGKKETERNLNIRGAAMHALGDCLQSVGVIAASIVIWVGAGREPRARDWYNIADPIASLFFAALTMWVTRSIFVDVMRMLMESVPRGTHSQCVRSKLEHLPKVVAVADVLMWSVSTGCKAIAARLVADADTTGKETQALLAEARSVCRALGFQVVTIEIELISEAEASASSAST
jgi:zinc transporter 2